MEDNINEKDIDVQDNDNKTSYRGKTTKKGNKQMWKQKMQSRNFKLIDKRFLQKREIFPGIISLNKPISAAICLDLYIMDELFYDCLNAAFYRWAMLTEYSEIRALKGLNGLPSSASDLTAIEETSLRLTVCMVQLFKELSDQGNLGMLLMKKGQGTITLPKLIMDMLVHMNSFYMLHEPVFLERSQFLFDVQDIRHVMSENMEKKIKGLKPPFNSELNFEKSYFYLNRFSHLTNFMPSSTHTINELMTMSSPYLMNTYCLKTEDDIRDMLVAQHTTAHDLSIASLIRMNIKSLGLSDYHIDGFTYRVPENQLVHSIKRIILEEYCGIEDKFISPTTLQTIKRSYIVDSTQITNI